MVLAGNCKNCGLEITTNGGNITTEIEYVAIQGTDRMTPKDYHKVHIKCPIRRKAVAVVPVQESATPRFYCSYEGCKVWFSIERFLDAHVNIVHKGKIPEAAVDMVKCDVPGCDRTFRSGKNMRMHRNFKHREKKEPEVLT